MSKFLKKQIQHLKCCRPNPGMELLFCNFIKQEVLPETKFKIIGEEVHFTKPYHGRCDLWLEHPEFLLSLELKVGTLKQIKKQKKLVSQVTRYTEALQYYFPQHHVLGMGSFWIPYDDILFFHYKESHDDIETLKQSMLV